MGWAEEKAAGNAAYKAGRTDDAVECYARALQDPAIPVDERCTTLSNRAQMFLKLSRNEAAIEDCSAALLHNPNHVKALFRRAAAYEALKDFKAARADYEATLQRDGSVSDAAAGLTRCEVHLGLAPSAGRFEGGRALARGGGGGGGSGGGGPRISEEDARAIAEAQNRVRDIKKQQLRGAEQKRATEVERRRADLTVAQLEKLPEDRAVFAAVGRMYVRSTPAAARAKLDEDRAAADKRLRVCGLTLEHLQRQEKEAIGVFEELVGAVNRKGGA